MPGVVRTLGADGVTPAPWASLIGQVNSAARIAAGVATRTTALTLDAYQNCTSITAGNLSQVVTIGAGFFTTTATISEVASPSAALTSIGSVVGWEEGMRVSDASGFIPLNTTIVSITGSTAVLSATPTGAGSGISVTVGPGGGVMVGTGLTGSGIAVPSGFAHSTLATTKGSPTATVASATGWTNGYQVGAVDANTGDEVITPGTSYTISGSTLTLSANALLPETACYACSVLWTAQSGTVHP